MAKRKSERKQVTVAEWAAANGVALRRALRWRARGLLGESVMVGKSWCVWNDAAAPVLKVGRPRKQEGV